MIRYLRIYTLYFQHSLQYRARNFMFFIISFINPLVMLMFWRGILTNTPQFGVWDGNKINSYYLLIVVMQSMLQHHAEYQVAYVDIKRGELMRELLKPFSYLKLRMFSEAPPRLIQGFYSILTVSILTYLFGRTLVLEGLIDQLFPVLIIIANGYFISFFFKMVLAFCAFWLTNIRGLMETSDVFTILFCGLVLPLNLAPQWLQTVANFTPYPYILYYPATAIIGLYNSTELYGIIISQFAWILVLYGLYQLMWNKGLKQFTGVGQ